jgi:hypothetical protein
MENPSKYGIEIIIENFETKKIFGYSYFLCKPKDIDSNHPLNPVFC